MNEKEYKDFIKQWKKENKDLIENNEGKKVFIECLPTTYGFGANINKLNIDWKKSIGYKVHFLYHNIEDDLKIVDYITKKQTLIIKYKNKKNSIKTNSIVRGQLSVILGNLTSEFKVEIGQTFKDDKRDLKIINRERRPRYKKDGTLKCNDKWYMYRCNKCGAELWVIESGLLRQKQNCACCANKTVVEGINDISTTDDWMIPIINDIEFCKTHTHSCSVKFHPTCPICGRKQQKETAVYNIYKYKNISCVYCSDNISIPEKIMFNILEQLLGEDFTYQYSKTNNKWCEKYKYDFYFEKYGQEYIIETHGIQHYKENTNFKMSLEEAQQNDKDKKELALENGIKKDNYIVIDCRKSELDFIKNNILHSKLNELFDLNNIDWLKCEEFCCDSLVKEACEYWNKGINNTKDISNVMKVGRGIITKWLKQGDRLNWCKYNPKKEMAKHNTLNNKASKPIEIFKNGESLGIFPSCSELERQSEKLFGVKLYQCNILYKFYSDIKQYKGFNFKRIPKEEYEERLKKQEEKIS